MFTKGLLCISDQKEGFKKVSDWFPVDRVMLWGDAKSVLTKTGQVSQKFWEKILEILG